ncbi:response regulator [Ktedonobacter racemifer]|uniref:Response regulator receiver protein n=1 Tax=Ktedonobacter racemifer DSM 44963 TaxID=485913 RepID=D6TBZ9_KTERA|nr:response regulator [Ktedonobacter racemifer]EFH88035.1 response regulator receiver protein [Ktedonobacter racemifer DSM 44963]
MDKSQQAGCEQVYRIHILIVDDDPLLGDLLLEALQQETYEAQHVLSGEMALTTLQTIIPTLVLLDYHLPGMNGLELVGWLRSQEKWAHIPVLLMSADVPREARGKEHLRTLGKPFELETLLQSVAELLVSGA